MGSCSSKQEEKLFERQSTAKERGKSIKQQGTNGETLDDVEDYLKEIENHISPTPNGIFNESEMLEKSIHKNINKPPRKAFQASSKDKRNSTDSGIVDAWKHSKGIPKPMFVDHNNNSDQMSTAENEYNKEGVDLVSTVENGLSRRVSPDEFPEYDMTKPILYREESDEAFDPSTLVDIEKFKAVNFPSSKANAEENDTNEQSVEAVNETTEAEDEELRFYDDIDDDVDDAAEFHTEILHHQNLLSPSVMYNEDERALMESIEKDFVQSLPGAVS